MKKRIISAISILLILIISSFVFASCGKKDNDKSEPSVVPATSANEETTKDVNSEDVEYETVYVIVTDKNGQPKTNENNEAITETSKVVKTTSKKTKKAKESKQKTKTQAVKGGTDPYVEDPF